MPSGGDSPAGLYFGLISFFRFSKLKNDHDDNNHIENNFNLLFFFKPQYQPTFLKNDNPPIGEAVEIFYVPDQKEAQLESSSVNWRPCQKLLSQLLLDTGPTGRGVGGRLW